MKRTFLASMLFLLLLLPLESSADEGLKPFLGYWYPEDEKHWCSSLSKDEWETEGAQMIIGKNKLMIGYLGSCKDVGQWIDKGRMRISASCNAGETFRNINAEFAIGGDGVLRMKGGHDKRGFLRCAKFGR